MNISITHYTILYYTISFGVSFSVNEKCGNCSLTTILRCLTVLLEYVVAYSVLKFLADNAKYVLKIKKDLAPFISYRGFSPLALWFHPEY